MRGAGQRKREVLGVLITSRRSEYKGKDGNYSIDHSALVYLMDKDGKYLSHFAYGTPAAKMTETMRRYL